jgi:hypothetical protein
MAECALRLGEEPDKGTLSCAKAIEVKLLRRYQVEGEDLQEVREFVLLKPFPNCRLAQYELLLNFVHSSGIFWNFLTRSCLSTGLSNLKKYEASKSMIFRILIPSHRRRPVRLS